MRRSVFDFAEKTKKIKEIEKEINSPGFWQDKRMALKKTEKLGDLKKETEMLNRITEQTIELKELLEITEENDKKTLSEIEEKTKEVENLHGKLKKRLFFSGKYDKGDAVITIYAGAGGDDAEDWTRILFEMYCRFVERIKR